MSEDEPIRQPSNAEIKDGLSRLANWLKPVEHAQTAFVALVDIDNRTEKAKKELKDTEEALKLAISRVQEQQSLLENARKALQESQEAIKASDKRLTELGEEAKERERQGKIKLALLEKEEKERRDKADTEYKAKLFEWEDKLRVVEQKLSQAESRREAYRKELA